MSTHIDGGCGRIGRRMGLFCAFLGVMTAFAMIQVMGAQWDGLNISLVLMAALYLSPLFVAAAFFGTKAGTFLCRKGNRLGLNIWIGMALALGSVTIEVLACTFVYVVMRGSGEILVGSKLFWTWFTPLAIIMMFGGIPAAGLGVLYGFLVRSRLDKLVPHDDAASLYY